MTVTWLCHIKMPICNNFGTKKFSFTCNTSKEKLEIVFFVGYIYYSCTLGKPRMLLIQLQNSRGRSKHGWLQIKENVKFQSIRFSQGISNTHSYLKLTHTRQVISLNYNSPGLKFKVIFLFVLSPFLGT